MTETHAMDPAILVDTVEAARLLSVSQNTIWNMTVPRGDLPCVRIGRAVRFDVADLRTWIERRKSKARKARA